MNLCNTETESTGQYMMEFIYCKIREELAIFHCASHILLKGEDGMEMSHVDGTSSVWDMYKEYRKVMFTSANESPNIN